MRPLRPEPALIPPGQTLARPSGARLGPLRELALRRESIVLAILIVGSIGFDFTHPTFLTPGNLEQIFTNVAVVALVSIGMTLVIVTGGIDVSVGSALALCMFAAGKVIIGGGGLVLAIVAALLVGAFVGVLNGTLVAYGRIHPIIVTLGTLNIIRAVHIGVLGKNWLIPPHLAEDLALGTFVGIPNAWWMTMIVAALLTAFVIYRPLGRAIYAVGGNAEAARLAGVNVPLVTVSVYVLMGVLVGFAAVIQLGQAGTVQPNAGTGLELQAIAATVIGGTSILGGRGTIVGGLLGALLVEAVHNALITIGTVGLLEGLIVGILILIAVAADVLQHRRRRVV
jgi:ribose/xylose/arabinose/galactoside ABC-type transport system permease subunit